MLRKHESCRLGRSIMRHTGVNPFARRFGTWQRASANQWRGSYSGAADHEALSHEKFKAEESKKFRKAAKHCVSNSFSSWRCVNPQKPQAGCCKAATGITKGLFARMMGSTAHLSLQWPFSSHWHSVFSGQENGLGMMNSSPPCELMLEPRYKDPLVQAFLLPSVSHVARSHVHTALFWLH